MSPARAGTTFLKKCDAKSELKHEKHKRSSLKLAFLMQIRNHVLSEHFFAFGLASAERNENHKNQLGGGFGSAGRNAQVRWGEI